jgi:hypothetical protein
MHAPVTVAFEILPYMFTTFVRRLWPDRKDHTVVAADHVTFDEESMKEPLIPYHRIYGRRWRR